MKFPSIFALSLAALPKFGTAIDTGSAVGAGAPALVGRAASGQTGAVIFSNSVQKVDKAVLVLDKAIAAVKNANYTTEQLNAILDGTDLLYNTLLNETVVAKKAPKLDEQCADYVQYFVSHLIKDSQKLSKDSIRFKPFTYENGLGDIFVSLVQQLQAAADAFADVLISKVPASRKAVATKDKAQVDNAFQDVINAPVPS